MSSLKDFFKQQQFSTLISIADNDLFAVEKHKVIKRINSTRNPFSFYPVVIVADPFLFVYKDELYLFYEKQIKLTGKGVIKMTKTRDLKNWTKPIVVLKENFHLSFPNIFEINGQIYMMPETGNDNSIRLYKPNDDLTEWTFYKSLIIGRNFVDSSIFFHNNLYFLFTTDYTDETNILKLYYSTCIDGEWSEHTQSPIAIGKNTGRCGGSIFKFNEKIYRPCQLSQKMYGDGLEFYNITSLSKDFYYEEKVKTVIPNSNIIYRKGGHHFNYCYFENKTIVATDYIEMTINIFEIIKRIVIKIKL